MLLPGIECKCVLLLILASVLLVHGRSSDLSGTRSLLGQPGVHSRFARETGRQPGRLLNKMADGVRAGLELGRSIVKRATSDRNSSPNEEDPLLYMISHLPDLIRLLQPLVRANESAEQNSTESENTSLVGIVIDNVRVLMKLIFLAVLHLLTSPIRAIGSIVPLPFSK